jgi:hypothetical protein
MLIEKHPIQSNQSTYYHVFPFALLSNIYFECSSPYPMMRDHQVGLMILQKGHQVCIHTYPYPVIFLGQTHIRSNFSHH